MCVIKLKNGTSEISFLVDAIMKNLQKLPSFNPTYTYDLVHHCIEENYDLSEGEIKYFRTIGFISPNGEVIKSVRNVVQSSYNGNGLLVYFNDPKLPLQK